MLVEPGTLLLHYRIADKLGEGGMGVVWKAVDTTLDREVAIKVLPPQLATHPERLARFDREAKLLASLNHPNIAAVYGFHEHDGVRFVVMELVAGEDLSQRIGRGALAVADALEIAEQIATGLAAAHDRGVVHRDLKPANVRLTPDGIVKVLDFGLAKSLEAEASGSGDPAASPTMTTGGTAFGVILGTASYMSPEQARAKPVDRRADLWALGCVLYEMLVGKRAFEGETVTDTLSAVISREPDWDLLPDDTPTATRRLLRRCLEKKLVDRVRDAADARLELLEPDEPASAATATPGSTPTPRRSWLGLAAAALAGAAVVGAAWILSPPPPVASIGPLPPVHQITFTGEVADPNSFGSQPAGLDLAADGRTVVYMTRDRSRAILIDLDGGGSQTLFTAEPGTSLFDVAWSPDGGRVFLMTWPYSEHVLSIPRFGGEPRPELDLRKLVGLNGIFARQLHDDRWLVLGDHNTLYIGPDPAALEARGTQLHGDGVFRIEGLDLLGRIALSSDARRIAFSGFDADGRERSGVADETGKREFVAEWAGLAPVTWTADDRTLYMWRETGNDVGDLLRVATDPSTGRPTAAPALVYPALSARSVQVSADGERLALRMGDRVANLRELTLDGTPTASDNLARVLTRGTGRWEIRDILPDGTLLAALAGDLGWELFAVSDDDVHRSLVRHERSPRGVAASPDGDAIAVTIERPAPAVLIHDLSDNRSRTIPVPEPLTGIDWSPDGTHIAAMTTSSADHMVVVDVERGEARTVILDCGDKCEFAAEGIRSGPEWPYVAVTSEVDTWIANVETGQLRHVATDTWTIMAWQDSFIYFMRGGGQTDWPGYVLFRVPDEGGPEERLLDLPLDCADYEIDRAGRSLVWVADESRLDLRLVDGLGEQGGLVRPK
jgi:serine/threonine protein kinase/WD40 repeat protein